MNEEEKMSAVAGIRTRAMSLEGSDPNQLDHNCLNPMYTWEVYIVFYKSQIIKAIGPAIYPSSCLFSSRAHAL